MKYVTHFLIYHTYIRMHIVIFIDILFWWSPFIPSRKLDEVLLINIYGSNVP